MALLCVQRTSQRVEHALEYYVDAGLGLLRRNSRLQPRHHQQPGVYVRHILRSSQQIASRIDRILHHGWNPHIRSFSNGFTEESRLRNSDDFERRLAKLDSFSEHGRIETKTLFPKRVADDSERRPTPRSIHFGCEHPPGRGIRSQRRKIISTNETDTK